MSRVYFHSQHGTAEVSGRERALFGAYCSRSLLASLGIEREGIDHKEHCARIIRLLEDPAYLKGYPESLPTFLAVQDGKFRLPEFKISVFCASLNTLLATGSDPMILAARLHGQCEIHAFVEGCNRAWLAEIIDLGLCSGIYREGQGWESVQELLLSREDCPVVTSYSVCDSFPNEGVARDAGVWQAAEDDECAWDEVSHEEAWRLCLEAVRLKPGLEMKPDRWHWPAYHFGEPATGFHVLREATKEG